MVSVLIHIRSSAFLASLKHRLKIKLTLENYACKFSSYGINVIPLSASARSHTSQVPQFDNRRSRVVQYDSIPLSNPIAFRDYLYFRTARNMQYCITEKMQEIQPEDSRKSVPIIITKPDVTQKNK